MPDMEPVVRVSFTPTKEEFVRLQSRLLLSRTGIPRVLVLFAAIGLALMLTFPTSKAVEAGWTAWAVIRLAFLLALFLGAIFYAPKRLFRRQWEGNPGLHEPRVFEFDEVGIRYAAASFQGQLDWSLVQKVTVEADAILIWIGTVCHYLPLSALADEQRTALTDLLVRKVPGFRGLPR